MRSRFDLILMGALTAMFVLSTFNLLIAQIRTSETKPAIKHRIYDHLMNPREHPDYARYHVQPPDWDTFGNRTRFINALPHEMRNDSIVNYTEGLEKFTRTYKFGDMLKTGYPLIFAKNLNELVDEIKRRDLFLYALLGYVPGSGPGGFWRQYKVPQNAIQLLESKLGDRWLGMENGEQDGRYVGGFSQQMYPSSANRIEQYFNFQRHFEKHGDDAGNRMNILVSLNFSHYFAKEGIYTINGAEVAQALPNLQVYYSFIRGAGKQYGLPWFGHAAVFNRWGWKSYGPVSTEGSLISGRTKGASLNLLKRLMYNLILYNSMMVGLDFEFFDGNKVSPVGQIQLSAKKWLEENGQPGVMLTPIAIMVDFFSGWSFPRHLYTGNVYRVWGNLPYEAGDYLTDGVLDMFYPDYQNSSYYHDESGFISPTPYGDVVDCVLSDASEWLLERYPIIVVGSELSGNVEVRDKLSAYIEQGGHLIITAGSLANIPGGLAGIKVSGPALQFKSQETIKIGFEKVIENTPFELFPLNVPDNARVMAKCGQISTVVEVPSGKGMITVFASPFGVCAEPAITEQITNEVDKPLLKPYPLLRHVRIFLDKAFRSQMLFEVAPDLSLVTCRKKAGEYILGISNNSLKEKSLQIVSHCGPIKSIREFELGQSEKKAIGYMVEGFENADVGISNEWRIAGGDVRIFDVHVEEKTIEPIPHNIPPSRPTNRILPLRRITSIKEEILKRPTFFNHFDKVVVDWKYLREREKDVLKKESGWISRQKLSIIVDLSSGINLYPDLRLVNNLEEDYLSSVSAIDDVMEKMEIIGSHDLILSVHRFIENNFTREQFWSSMDSTVREICRKAGNSNITVHLRNKIPGRRTILPDLKAEIEFVNRVNAPNLRIAASTAILIANKEDRNNVANLLKDKVGLWIISVPEFDVANVVWNVNGLIANYKQKSMLSEIISIAPDVPIVLDGLYNNQDEEYLDACALNNMISMIKER